MTKPPKAKKPKQPDPPWKVLWPGDRGATEGDKDREKLLAAVGFALSRWEELEEELARLFYELAAVKLDEPAGRAYGTINNFYGRADALSAAAVSFFHHATYREKIAGPDRLIEKTQPSFNDLLKHCREFAARRNEIAHGRYRHDIELGYFLKPAMYNAKKYSFEDWFGNYSYTSQEIYTYADHFSRLIQWTRDVRSAVETIAKKIS